MMPSAEFKPFSNYEAQTLMKSYHRQYKDPLIKLCTSSCIFLKYYYQFLVSAFMDNYCGFTNNQNVDK
jgi:hypothetical protein